MLNLEKCHFMVHERIVLGHLAYECGIEVDKVKIKFIEKLPQSSSVKVVHGF